LSPDNTAIFFIIASSYNKICIAEEIVTYFFLFFKRNDILVDVIIFAKDKAENQKKFCKKKNGGKYGKK